MRRFEILEHTADFQVRAEGSTIEELFIASLEGALEGAGYTTQGDKVFTKELKLSSFSLEGLLVSFLEEILFLVETEKVVYNKVAELKIEEKNLSCILEGKELLRMGVQIKGVTWHNLKIEKKDGIYSVIITFDV